MLPALYLMLQGNTALEPVVAGGSLIVAAAVLLFALVVFSSGSVAQCPSYRPQHADLTAEVIAPVRQQKPLPGSCFPTGCKPSGPSQRASRGRCQRIGLVGLVSLRRHRDTHM